MHLSTLLNVLLPVSTLAYTTVNQVIADIIALDAQVKILTASVTTYTGGIINAVPPAIDFVSVEARLSKADVDGRLLSPSTLSVADTQDIVNTVASTLAVDNPAAVDELKQKKAVIVASGGGLIVQAALRALLAGHLELTNSITTRTPASELASVQRVADIITVALEDGINSFS